MRHYLQSPDMSHLSACNCSTACHIGYVKRQAKTACNGTSNHEPFSQGLRSSRRSSYARKTRRRGYSVSAMRILPQHMRKTMPEIQGKSRLLDLMWQD